MAELKSEYVFETLNSRQLLALLFVCESGRKNTLADLNLTQRARPKTWVEFLDRFGARLAKLPESEKTYLLGSHLQSVEELDIYSNSAMQALLKTYHEPLAMLTSELERDPRFA